MIDTSVKLNGLTLKNPIIMASGTFGYGTEFSDFYNAEILGGMSSKGLTRYPKEGNKHTRLHEVRGGLMNSIGMQNPGVEHFIAHELATMKSLGPIILANIGGDTLEQYVEGVAMLSDTDVDIIELNISCPNVKAGGMAFGIQSQTAYEVVAATKKVCTKPLMVKLSPNAMDIVEMAKSVEAAGADSISLVNTFKGLAIDIYRKKPIFDHLFAGVSGPMIKPMALRMVYEAVKAVKIPVVGIGGIEKVEDVIEYIMAGATAVQVGAANFANPLVGKELVEGLNTFMEQHHIRSLDEIRGIV